MCDVHHNFHRASALCSESAGLRGLSASRAFGLRNMSYILAHFLTCEESHQLILLVNPGQVINLATSFVFHGKGKVLNKKL